MRTLGLIGGMGWESTALYYGHLNELARQHLGGLHSAKLLLWSLDFAGSLIGAVMLVQFGLTAPLVFAGALILFGTLAYIAHPAAGEKIA